MDLNLDSTRLNIFTAHTRVGRVIGMRNEIPWKFSCKGDLKFLNMLTRKENTAVVMGRVTFESLGKPLVGRLNLVVTSRAGRVCENVVYFRTFKEAVEHCQTARLNIVVFGGENIYKEALQYEHKLFCTILDEEFYGDRFFPEYKGEVHDITEQVDGYLRANNVKVTWDLVNDKFYENGLHYKFYVSK